MSCGSDPETCLDSRRGTDSAGERSLILCSSLVPLSTKVFCRMFDCLQGALSENILAKALYDNSAESPDELSFRKGDILTVLERNTQGLDGWWLCSLHGRQGIVPGNRLKVLVGMYDKQQSPPIMSPNQLPLPHNAFSKPHPSSQYTAMHPAPCTPSTASISTPQDNVYMLPPSHSKSASQGLYQGPTSGQDIYQVPQISRSSPQDVYQVPISVGGSGLTQDVYQVPSSMNLPQDIYQTPSTIESRTWNLPIPPGKVVVPTRVGQVYVYDTGKMEQDEYDVPRHLSTSRDIYDVPPTRNQQHQQVYDIPPTVSKDVCEGPDSEETYDVPPNFAKVKKDLQDKLALSQSPRADAEEVYDVPPPSVAVKRIMEFSAPSGQEVYDIPTSLRQTEAAQLATDVYDFPRERAAVGEDGSDYVYDVPPQVVRDVAPGPSDEPCVGSNRLSGSSTGSARSTVSGGSLDTVPVKEPADARLNLELEPAMERLARLQQAAEGSVSLLVALVSAGWRGAERTEAGLVGAQQAAERARTAVRELLEFARGAVANATQAPDRTLQAKLSKQVQKIEEAYQGLVMHSQVLDRVGLAPTSPPTPSAAGAEDLDRLVACLRSLPDDTKQLGSFLHGNAALLFRRTKQRPPPADPLGQLNPGNSIAAGQMAGPERATIQSRPLPSPPKFASEEERLDRLLPTNDDRIEDYDYVHLQGKEEFEKSQRQQSEKGNSIWNNKSQLEQQQLKQFEQLEPEVTRPINSELSSWTPPSQCPPTRSKLCMGDRQLLLFYLEQCESNVTALTGAVDAFFSSISGNQPPKIFVAHSKFVILNAHKLVFIGDTLSRQAKSPEIRAHAAHHSAALCERLKDIVTSTKTAALQYPSPSAARDTMERVGELAACTQQFCLILGQLATM
ncbi:breast cancer anti-estrogen resistance protein 1-like isoform X3 [Brienomyrus brachyistius]|uniref:breast cancer anti-estrogen resistance protein 1-like isoform X3 n=1 Tax=Brienomyrus brachyistius TaxID=42636 RepID=UPI0020B3B405|nr:breast cancer anti-estrogen resistance protein 1-like isoform X3 [Brienomyrus brachyistius]